MIKLFISMIGLEERVLGFYQMENRPMIDEHLFFINKEFENDHRVITYKTQIKDLMKESQLNILPASYSNSLELVKQFNQYISKKEIDINQTEIHLDISTFNRQNLLTILFLLRKKYGIKNLICYYTVPQDTNIYISKFAQSASTIPFFDGMQSIDKNKLLVLLAGFEFDRAMYLYEKIEPSRTVIAIGDEPTDQRFYEINRKVVDKLKNNIQDCEEIKVSANNPFKAKDDLEKIINEYDNEYNIIMAPMNTKLQVLGLYLSWENFPEIQVVYSCPEKFAEWLTTGIKRTDSYKLI